MESNQSDTTLQRVPNRLWWIRDAPMFIDATLVRRTHDTIVWPTYENETRQNETNTAEDKETTTSGKFAVSAQLPDWLSNVGAQLGGGIDIDRKQFNANRRSHSSLQSGTLVSNSERKLVELVAKYVQSFPTRVLFLDLPTGTYTDIEGKSLSNLPSDYLAMSPRPLVFVNILEETPIFPTVAEMEDGGFRRIYEALDAILLPGKSPRPAYSEAPKSRQEYWSAIEENFQSRTAMEEVEKACDGQRIGWIDFRLLFQENGETAHLHVVPAGEYHTGVFGYNFVHRGYKYGCRLIGTLKSGNDINVLAIYDN